MTLIKNKHEIEEQKSVLDLSKAHLDILDRPQYESPKASKEKQKEQLIKSRDSQRKQPILRAQMPEEQILSQYEAPIRI